MSAQQSRRSYDRTQRIFHWGMAALIFAAIAIGIYASYLPSGTSPRRELLEIHKSLGMTVLVLLPLRLFYRLLIGEPAYRVSPSPQLHLAARLAHWSLYALMLLMPVSGYVYSAAGGYSLPWFGLFRWPRVLPHDKPLAESGQVLHYWLAWIIGIVLTLHVLAVIWHHWIKRDEVLSRMTT